MINSNSRISFSVMAALALLACLTLCSCGPKSPATTEGNAAIQSEVASSAALATVSGGGPAVAQAYDATDLDKLGGVNGTASIKGAITNVIYPPSPGQNVTLYFGSGIGARASIPAADFSQLPDLRNYVGKQVLITGTVEQGKRFPIITLGAATDMKQIN
jgi:hypothetical protein